MFSRAMFWIALTALLLAGCSMPEQIDETKDWSVSRLYTEAHDALNDGDYEQAVKYYEKLEARFPFGPYATQSQLDIIYAYFKDGEPDSAIAAADRFIKLNPQHDYVDYAYYMKGLANYNREQSFIRRYFTSDPSVLDAGAAQQAFRDFADLLERYPESRYAEDARQRMLYLRNNVAKYQLHVARFYLRREAYLAAANRANRVVSEFQRTEVVPDALEIMIEAYTKLGMHELAADAQRVLALNSPATAKPK